MSLVQHVVFLFFNAMDTDDIFLPVSTAAITITLFSYCARERKGTVSFNLPVEVTKPVVKYVQKPWRHVINSCKQ